MNRNYHQYFAYKFKKYTNNVVYLSKYKEKHQIKETHNNYNGVVMNFKSEPVKEKVSILSIITLIFMVVLFGPGVSIK